MARSLFLDKNSGHKERIEARALFEDIYKISRRVYGEQHPETIHARIALAKIAGEWIDG